MSAAQGAGLVGAGDGAHALGEQDYAPAGADDLYYLPYGVGLVHEVLFRHYLHHAEYHGQVAAEELVVAHDKVEGVRQEGRRGEHIVHARGVVGDYYIALTAVFGHVVDICKVRVVLLGEHTVHYHFAQQPVDKRGDRMQLPAFKLLLLGEIFHRCFTPSIYIVVMSGLIITSISRIASTMPERDESRQFPSKVCDRGHFLLLRFCI